MCRVRACVAVAIARVIEEVVHKCADNADAADAVPAGGTADTGLYRRSEDSTGTSREVFEVRTDGARPRPRWRRPARNATVSDRHATTKRSQARLVPLLSATDANRNPLEAPGFLEGLKSAGYLQPLDVSRKAIKSRFTHGLKKEEVRFLTTHERYVRLHGRSSFF